MAEPSIASLFQAFNEAQQRRPGIYRAMQEAFDHRMEGCAHDYQDKQKEITARHVDASKAIIAVAAAFEARPATTAAAALIRSLQLLEKEKLQATAEVFVLQQQHLDKQDENTGFEDAEFDVVMKQKKKNLNRIISEINDILDEIKEEEVAHMESK